MMDDARDSDIHMQQNFQLYMSFLSLRIWLHSIASQL